MAPAWPIPDRPLPGAQHTGAAPHGPHPHQGTLLTWHTSQMAPAGSGDPCLPDQWPHALARPTGTQLGAETPNKIRGPCETPLELLDALLPLPNLFTQSCPQAPESCPLGRHWCGQFKGVRSPGAAPRPRLRRRVCWAPRRAQPAAGSLLPASLPRSARTPPPTPAATCQGLRLRFKRPNTWWHKTATYYAHGLCGPGMQIEHGWDRWCL